MLHVFGYVVNLPTKSLGLERFFFFKEMNTFIQQGCIKVIESDGKGINIILLIFLVNYFIVFILIVKF